MLKHYLNSTEYSTVVTEHLIDNYEKVSHLYWVLDKITERSYELINRQIQFDYTSWFVLLVVFLCVEFLMGSMHFKEILEDFN